MTVDLTMWDESYVEQAFFLQAYISREGTKGINFTGAIEHYYENEAADEVEDAVMRNMRSKGF